MTSTNPGLIRELQADGVLRTPEIIEAFLAVPRHDFVSPEARAHAYENRALAIGYGQTIS
ncbi:MAG: protein-L-isoaspartate O-methyltransferase, partial [Acidobacteriota bacterium]